MISHASSSTRKREQTQTVAKLYLENTLLRVAGALFCHDAKRAPTRVEPIQLNTGVSEKRIVIRIDPEYGQPGPLAHKVFIALMKKHSGYGRPVPRVISFTQRELARLVDREWSGTASQQLVRALHEIHHTFVKASFQCERSKLWQEHSFNIFPEITISRRSEDSPVIEACMVALAEPMLASLRDSHFTCLNFALMSELGTIGQALYMRLFFHFANLFGEVGKGRLSVTKRYEDICTEWLGGLTILRYRSLIEREQLGPHLRQLCAVGFLAAYSLDKTTDGESFKVTLRPGPAFFADYQRYYRRHAQGELQWTFHEERRGLQEPMQVVRLFIEKRTGQPLSPLAYISNKEVETARQLIARIGFDNLPAFIDYGLSEARKTNFDVQLLAGIKQYVDAYLKQSEAAAFARVTSAIAESQKTERSDHDTYDRFRRSQVRQLFADLPADQQAALRAEAVQLAGTGPLSTQFTEIRLLGLVGKRYAERLTTFEVWQRSK